MDADTQGGACEQVIPDASVSACAAPRAGMRAGMRGGAMRHNLTQLYHPQVCRKARYQIHADPLRARAFEVAFEATQKMMEVASERLPEISEADALTELVCDMIHDIVLSDTFMADDPHGSGGKHSLTSKTVLMKRLEMRVGAEVATALQSINDQAEHFRRRVKPELKALWPEFVSEEDNLNERIEEVRSEGACSCSRSTRQYSSALYCVA